MVVVVCRAVVNINVFVFVHVCRDRHVPELLRRRGGATESFQAAASPGRHDRRSGVGHRQERPVVPSAVHPPRSPAHAAVAHPTCQVNI